MNKLYTKPSLRAVPVEFLIHLRKIENKISRRRQKATGESPCKDSIRASKNLATVLAERRVEIDLVEIDLLMEIEGY